ncbi:GL26671 [Drosophila persimilis]|uniref:PI-PLC X domain-containing protein 2 isoform X1 n=3 Tax=pseudoobscura subgroup TaxID=32358 RepID=A0A6I8UIQ3_DROPS|nr:PI-PLC X domain-containing protein 2 isoform X1 [Drosophila pseudoobscura]XP_002021732.1 PI-PLC X domain-containing protein 2 [Drosophila persimilis]EDW25575.1 GL26671 [Drosophila persimilis]
MSKEHWMRDLPPELRDMSIINLAIPGSHNSMTYGINGSSQLAPDAEPAIRRWYRFFPCFVRRWSKTQSSSIIEQLSLGVRYFDLRIAQRDEKFYYCHALFAMEIFEPLIELRQFLDSHPEELVVLDMQHFYDLTPNHHQQLHKELIQFFGHRLYSTTEGSLLDCTLNRCLEMQRQVVIIYRRCPIPLPLRFWPSFAWPTPWPNKASVKKLQSFLEDSLLSRQPQQGYVSQCLITPTGRYIAFRVFFSLKRTARRVDKKLYPWITEQTPGPFDPKEKPRVNVFLGDFVELKDGQFCNWVMDLNSKLEPEEEDEAAI